MELIRIDISEWRSIDRASIEVQPINVLLGPNGSGKSSILEALEHRFEGRAHRSDSFVEEDWPTLKVRFRLTKRHIPESLDNVWLQKVFGSFAHVDSDIQVEQAIRDTIDESVQGLPQQQERLARDFFVQQWQSPTLEWESPYGELRVLADCSGVTLEFAEVLAKTPIEGHPLVTLGRRIIESPSGWHTIGDLGEDAPEPPLPTLVRIDSDPSRLEEFLESAIRKISDKCWHLERGSYVREHSQDPGEAVSEQISRLPISFPPPLLDQTPEEIRTDDAWLESGSDALSMRVAVRLAPVIALLEQRAQELAPPFIHEAGTIRLKTVHPKNLTASELRRIVVYFEETGVSTPVPFALLGAGTRRWIAASVREAARQLLDSKRSVVDPDSQIEVPPPESSDVNTSRFNQLLIEGAHRGSLDNIRLQPGDDPGIVLVDEPEVHLDPYAQRQVAEWLIQRARDGSTVFLTTHSPTFLLWDSELTSFTRVEKRDGRTRTSSYAKDALALVEAASRDMGFSPATAFLLMRACIVVEGEHDLKVLRTFYGGHLREGGFLLVAIRGTNNAEALAHYEFGLLQQLKVPVRIIVDQPSEQSTKAQRSFDERIEREVRELSKRGVDAQIIHFEQRDVLCALPEAAIQRAYPSAVIEGWRSVISENPEVGFKSKLLLAAGIDAGPDEFLDRVLKSVEPTDRPSMELQRAVEESLASVGGMVYVP